MPSRVPQPISVPSAITQAEPVLRVGDAQTLGAGARGGKSTLVGANASTASGTAHVWNWLSGDARVLEGGQGGNDVLRGGHTLVTGAGLAATVNLLAGDAITLAGDGSRCGNDLLVGGSASNQNSLSFGACDATNLMAGDTWLAASGASLGNDTLLGGNASGQGHVPGFPLRGVWTQNFLYGDLGAPGLPQSHAQFPADGTPESAGLLPGAVFGNDSLVGGSGQDASNLVGNTLVGDSWAMQGGARGGADVLKGGSGTPVPHGLTNSLFGDAQDDMRDGSIGGNDTLVGGAGSSTTNLLMGDAGNLLISGSVGGSDRLTGGASGTNKMYGDANVIAEGAQAGDDVLTAGGRGSLNYLYGDAAVIHRTAMAGNDTLVAGEGRDELWGDAHSLTEAESAGADRFVFKAGNGRDTIHDFQPDSGDVIDLSGMRKSLRSFDAMVQQGRIEDDGAGNTILHLDARNPAGDVNTVTLAGVLPSQLHADDFVF